MKTSINLNFILICMIVLLVAGCNPDKKTPIKNEKLHFWLDATEKEMDFFKRAIAEYEKTNPDVKIITEFIPFKDLKPKLLGVKDDTRAPDLVLVTNDWIGELAEKNILSPIENINKNKFLDFSFKALESQNKLYAIPRSFEVLALIYNKDLMPNPPSNLTDLQTMSINLKKRGIQTLMYDNKNFYYHAPFYFAFNPDQDENSLFSKQNNKNEFKTNKNEFKINTPKTIKSFEFAKTLVTKEIVPKKSSYAAAVNLFCSQKVAMIISGPWALHEISGSSVNYAVQPINIMISRNLPRPFLGVKAIGITKSSTHPGKSRKFADYLCSASMQKKTLEELFFMPVLKSFYFDEKIPVHAKAFFDQTVNSVIMPGHSDMKKVWKELNWALSQVIDKDQDIQTTLEAAEIRLNDNK